MNAEEFIAKLLSDHLGAAITLVFLSLSIKLANFLAKKWPIPPASAPWWKRAAHFLLVNWPQWGDELEGEVKGLQTSTKAVPFVSWTKRIEPDPTDKAREILGEPKPEDKRADKGFINTTALALLGLISFILVLLFGCGCDGFKAPAYSTLTTMVKGAEAVRAELPDSCRTIGKAAINNSKSKPDAQRVADAVFARCQGIAKDIDATVDVVQTTRDAVYDVSALVDDPKLILNWAKTAVDSYRNLGKLLEEFKIQLAKIPGVN